MGVAPDLGDFVEAALVAAAGEGRVEEGLHHCQGSDGRDDACAEGEDVGVVVSRASRAVTMSWARAARMPGTLLAAIEIPMPEPQTAIPRSAFFEATRSPMALPKSG